MTAWVRWFFRPVFGVIVVLIAWVILRPTAAATINALGSLILGLVTLTYAWFNYSLVQEMREGNRINAQTIAEMQEGRRQAATPLVRAEGVTSSGTSHFFRLSNVGNSPAINLVISLQALPEAAGTTRAERVLGRGPVLVPGGEFQVEADFSPYAVSSVDSYGVVATYANVLGENFEAVTEFPRSRPSVLPGPDSDFRFTRSPSR